MRAPCSSGDTTGPRKPDWKNKEKQSAGDKKLHFPLSALAKTLGLLETQSFPDTLVTGWCIDSRTVQAGDLFIALKGEQQDGHLYVDAAAAGGAVAAMVSDQVSAAIPLLQVDDTALALQTLGAWARTQWGKPIVAVTGSAGKTGTKDAIASLLATRFQVGKTPGNLNNHLGLPLSLLRMPETADIGVLELGMNHAGEIRSLAAIAKPQIAVVTNVGSAHIENFESIEGIAAAKRELIEALPPTGIAILNADDARVRGFATAHPGKSITYGISSPADMRAEDVELLPAGSRFSIGTIRFETALPGRHNVLNILAAIATASAFGLQPGQLIAAVASLAPGKMRGTRTVWRGATIINDSYNSNPDAVRSMIDVLKIEPAKRRIAILGEMLELGTRSEELHRQAGRYAAEAGIDVVVGIHGAARELVAESLRTGILPTHGMFFENPEEAGVFLREFVRTGDAILFKGSRGTHVERALASMESES